MAKDVVEFLTWASEPTHDEGKLMGLKAMFACVVGSVFCMVLPLRLHVFASTCGRWWEKRGLKNNDVWAVPPVSLIVARSFAKMSFSRMWCCFHVFEFKFESLFLLLCGCYDCASIAVISMLPAD